MARGDAMRVGTVRTFLIPEHPGTVKEKEKSKLWRPGDLGTGNSKEDLGLGPGKLKEYWDGTSGHPTLNADLGHGS